MKAIPTMYHKKPDEPSLPEQDYKISELLEKQFGIKSKPSQPIINSYDTPDKYKIAANIYNKKYEHMLNDMSIDNLKNHVNFAYYKCVAVLDQGRTVNKNSETAVRSVRNKPHFIFDPHNKLEESQEDANKIDRLVQKVYMCLYFCREIADYNRERIMKNILRSIKRNMYEGKCYDTVVNYIGRFNMEEIERTIKEHDELNGAENLPQEPHKDNNEAILPIELPQVQGLNNEEEGEIDEEEAVGIYFDILKKINWKNKDEGKYDINHLRNVIRSLSNVQQAIFEATYVLLFKNIYNAIQIILADYHYSEDINFNITGHICAMQFWYQEVMASPDLCLYVIDNQLWQSFHTCMLEIFPNLAESIREALE